MSNKRLKAFGTVETWFQSPPELGGDAFCEAKAGRSVQRRTVPITRVSVLSHPADAREALLD
jgi:hypothetical protein